MTKTPLAAAALALALGLWGLGWGLPSLERARLLLQPEQQTEAFYKKIERARSAYYEKIGMNPIAHLSRVIRTGQGDLVPQDILASYSSFLVRTHHGDEQQILVMLSNLNPLKNRWYPQTFQYGGAYLFPLAVYLGILHAGRLIQLVPQAAFYYAHPDAIARVYLAVRAWSVIGWVFAVIILFYLGKRLAGTSTGFWASCFFAMAPACLGNAKLAKPHTWGAAWTLASIYFCLDAKETPRWKPLILAAIGYGLAIGATLSQIAFFPFLFWACWTSRRKDTLKRLLIAGGVTLGTFLITNFYVFGHCEDFLSEIYYFRQFSPFALRPGALWDFIVGVLRPSYGLLVWSLVILGVCAAGIQKRDRRWRAFSILWLIVMAYIAFQVQSLPGDPISSRLALALIGLGCVAAAWFIQSLPGAHWLNAACIGALGIQAVLYNQHFASDRVPRDNASQAALWIQKNVPAGGRIGHTQAIPHVIEFPPLNFTRYTLQSIQNQHFPSTPAPAYAVIPAWAQDARQILLNNKYVLIHTFAESPLQKRGLSDPFTTANFALEIYEKKKG